MTGPVLVTLATMMMSRTSDNTTRGQTKGLSGHLQVPYAS